MPTLAHALLAALKDHGAHEIFGIPGDFVKQVGGMVQPGYSAVFAPPRRCST